MPMKILRWFLVILLVLYGLAESFASISTAAAKIGRFHNAQLETLASGMGWPQMLLWMSVPLISFVSAVLLARRDARSVKLFALGMAFTVVNLVICENTPTYAQAFSPGERMIDWYGVGVLLVALGLMILTLRREKLVAD